MTYGLGTFWRNVPEGDYKLFPSDLKSGVDCRQLPYADGEMDAVVLDPPYMEGLFRDDGSIAGNGTHSAFQTAYSNGIRPEGLDAKWHNAVVQLYVQAAVEARKKGPEAQRWHLHREMPGRGECMYAAAHTR